jgi:hypothetical protein
MLSEDHKEIATGKKKDDEGYMARVELDSIEKAVSRLRKTIKGSGQQLPAWVQSKITRAADYIDTAAEYLSSDEDLDEGVSFKIKEKEHKESRPPLGASKLRKMTDSQLDQLPKRAKEIAGVRLPKFESTLTDRILAEMGCDCDMKPAKSVEDIAKKHNTSTERVEKQLKRGIKVEMEHTTDKNEAEHIALQHLAERPDYYTRLKKVEESTASGDEGLHDWFNKSKSKDGTPGWRQIGGKYAGKPCARQEEQTTTPKCGSSKIAEKLSDEEEDKAFNRKNKKDPNQPEKKGAAKPTYVKTELKEVKDRPLKGSGTKDACYNKVKSRYRVFPSAYASGAISKCRKVGADNWGNKSEEFIPEAENPCWNGYQKKGMKKKGKKMVPNCVPINEGVRIQSQSGQLMNIMLNWRNKVILTQLFFPQIRIPKRLEIIAAVEKVYPGAKVLTFRVSNIDPNLPLVQVNEEGPSLSVNRGEKLSVEQGGGLTAKGRKKYNRATGSNLKAPVTGKVKKGSKAWRRRKNFCSRSRSWNRPRGLAARRRWKC